MLNKLPAFIKKYDLAAPGEHIICAVSGGADSVALLYAMYLLREKLGIQLSAAHFNHHLRGEESNRDEEFVRGLCHHYDIPLFVGQGEVRPGKKGLEAAAREARYAFFDTLPGKIATAHTADDNAETVLMHMVRGTGLKGLGGIAPRRGKLIRPMLEVTRQEVLAFLEENYVRCVEDSSNASDLFLRNRLRHHVMPLLKEENPRIAESLSAMALRLRQDEDCLAGLAGREKQLDVERVKGMHPALRIRALEGFLKENGVKEPEARHLELAESLVFSRKPSASAELPGGVVIARRYDVLERREEARVLPRVVLPCPGMLEVAGYRVSCQAAESLECDGASFAVCPEGELVLRPRQEGDAIRLPGGRKSLKKLFIDRKIPAAQRGLIPVIADDAGVLAVYEIGIDPDRRAQALPAIRVRIEKI